VYDLTESSAAVGAIGIVQLVPMILASMLIGPVIDRRDRRSLLLVAQAGQAAASSLLLVGALVGDPPLPLLYAAAALNGALTTVALPTRAAMTPNLVPIALLPSANALNQVMWNTASIAGPALGGVVVARLGLEWAYGVDVATYVVAFAFALALRRMPPEHDDDAERDEGVAAVLAGVRYLRGRPVLQSTFTVDLAAMVFAMPRALFPVLAVERFGGDEATVGLLFSAIGFGALLGALGSGWVGGVQRMGRAVLVSVTLWGLGIIGFGLVGDRLAPALVFLALAGAADVISAVFRGAIQQLSVPDALRGRLSAFNILVVTGGPRLGDFQMGLVAAATSPTVAVVAGGVLCVVGVGAVASRVPQFARWRVGDPV
ncbi:MAG TPA: MFS transporter, partial [Acidimicrobiia bacterium]|nr:MFS transporter [Acidimicrobiia bacterium]